MLIHGVSYGLGTTQIGLDRMRRLGITPPEGAEDEDGEEGPKLDAQGRDGNGRVPVPHVTFKDGSDSHPGRAFFTDIVNPVRGHNHHLLSDWWRLVPPACATLMCDPRV